LKNHGEGVGVLVIVKNVGLL